MTLTSYDASPSASRYSGTRRVAARRFAPQRGVASGIVILATLILSACSQMGPQVLIAGRPQYNIAVQQTEAEQLLLNIVRNRYNDTILFLDITSIASGFSRGMNAGLLGSFSSGSQSGVTNIGGDIRENPNIFYAPNTGEKFVRQMLTPIDLRTVALLLQAGWSIERLMLLLGESANQLYNRPVEDEANEPDDLFLRVADSLRNLQRNHQLIVGLESGAEESDVALVLAFDAGAIESSDYRVICEGLKVACDGKPLRLRQGFGAPADANTLALATRSLFSTIYHLSRHVDAPAPHVAAGFAAQSENVDISRSATGSPLRQLFFVHSSTGEPEHAAVKVFYRDTWFFIADDDQDSKTTFALLSMLITLKSGDASGVAPLITIPSG
jgi:hypothetical protein